MSKAPKALAGAREDGAANGHRRTLPANVALRYPPFATLARRFVLIRTAPGWVGGGLIERLQKRNPRYRGRGLLKAESENSPSPQGRTL